MPDISIKDNLDLNIELEPAPGSAIAKYFKSALQFINPDSKIRKYAPLPLGDPAFTSLQAELDGAQPIPIVADGLSLTMKAGAGGKINVFVPDPHLEAGEKDSLFSPDKDGEDVPVAKSERYVSVSFFANAGSAASVGVSDVAFGFATDSSVTLASYQKFSVEPESPTFLDALKKTFASFQMPASLADLSAMPLDGIVTLAGAGSLKFSASTNLLAVSNPLATADLPSPFGTIALKEGASIRVGASFRLFGDYEIRVRKTSPTTIRLGYFRERGKEWKATVSGSAGLSASVGGSDDLFGQILSALSPDPEVEFNELKQAKVDKTTIASIQATIQAAIERTLEVATSLELGNTHASQTAFLYEVDLSAVDANSQSALEAALRGDLSGLERDGDAPPRGIKMVQSMFTNLRQTKVTLKINLLGIYNFISISKLTLKGKALYDPETGELILTDSASASEFQAAVVNVGNRPNAANPKQVRKILAGSLLITAAYRASDTLVNPPNLKSSHTYCEVHERTDRDTMADELGVAVGLGLMTRNEFNDLVKGATQFGRTLAYASADYNDSLATALFVENGRPRELTEYEDIGRQAMQVVASRGGMGDAVRLRPLQNDDVWRQMKGQGQSKFHTLLPEATDLQIGAITADYSTIVWWAETMNKTGQALANVKNYLVKNPGANSSNADFQKLRSDLAAHLKGVAVDTKEEFGRPWGLIAMDLLTGSRSEARVTFTGSVVNLSRARPVAVGAGRLMV